MTFTWTPALSVGVPSIDAQHQELFRRTQCLLLAVGDGVGGREVLRTLAFLGDYVATHFDEEEAAMHASGYPDLAPHAAEHLQFRQSFGRLRDLFAGGGLSAGLVQDVEREVCRWLEQHLQRTDRAMGQWLSRWSRAAS